MTEPELKPCPFCGSKDVTFFTGLLRGWIAACENCGAGLKYSLKTKEKATAKWNVTLNKKLKKGVKMTEELKPCPCCGSNAEMVEVTEFYFTRCKECGLNTQMYETPEEAKAVWNRRPEPEKPKVKTIPLSSLKDSDYVWIVGPRCGLYRSVEKAKKEFPDWNVPAFLCEVDVPTVNFDTFDQRIFDLVDDSENQGYIGNGEGDYPYYNPETIKQMYDVLMAGIREKGQFVKPIDIQVVKD